jgi:hypothetical protein
MEITASPPGSGRSKGALQWGERPFIVVYNTSIHCQLMYPQFPIVFLSFAQERGSDYDEYKGVSQRTDTGKLS